MTFIYTPLTKMMITKMTMIRAAALAKSRHFMCKVLAIKPCQPTTSVVAAAAAAGEREKE